MALSLTLKPSGKLKNAVGRLEKAKRKLVLPIIGNKDQIAGTYAKKVSLSVSDWYGSYSRGYINTTTATPSRKVSMGMAAFLYP